MANLLTYNSARTVTVPADPELQQTVPLDFPSANLGSTLDYWINLTNVMGFNDTVSSFSILSSVPAGVTITQIALSNMAETKYVAFEASGGNPNTSYLIGFSATFASGLVFTGKAYLANNSIIPSYSSVLSLTLSPDGNLVVSGGGGPDSSGNVTVDIGLRPTGITPGVYNSAIQVDAFGRVLSGSVAGGSSGSSGTVQSIGIISNSLSVSSNPVTTSGNLEVELETVGAPSSANGLTIDAFGRVTSQSANLINTGLRVDASKARVIPSDGSTITVPNNSSWYHIAPTSQTLNVLTINLPTTGLVDGQTLKITTVKIINSLTLVPTVPGWTNTDSMEDGSGFQLLWESVDGIWQRLS